MNKRERIMFWTAMALGVYAVLFGLLGDPGLRTMRIGYGLLLIALMNLRRLLLVWINNQQEANH